MRKQFYHFNVKCLVDNIAGSHSRNENKACEISVKIKAADDEISLKVV